MCGCVCVGGGGGGLEKMFALHYYKIYDVNVFKVNRFNRIYIHLSLPIR